MNRLLLSLSLCMVSITNAQTDAPLPPPYDKVNLLPFDPHGWYSNAAPIETLFKQNQPRIVIEVGCWLGASTRHMATLLPADGKIYAVDHWLGSVEHQPGKGFWHPALPQLYEQFLSNVIHSNLTEKIIPIRMSSLEASQYLKDLKADLVYIDASHDYEAVYSDLNAWYPHVKDSNGILCGDDWGHPPIVDAVTRFAEENNLKIVTPGAHLFILTK